MIFYPVEVCEVCKYVVPCNLMGICFFSRYVKGGRIRVIRAFRDNLGRFLPAYGFVPSDVLLDRLRMACSTVSTSR